MKKGGMFLFSGMTVLLMLGIGGCASSASLSKKNRTSALHQVHKDFSDTGTSGDGPSLGRSTRIAAPLNPDSSPPQATNPLVGSGDSGAMRLVRDPSGCVWYESRAEVEGDENTTPRTLRFRAVAGAEKKALRAYRPRQITREFLSSATEIREGGASKGSQYVEELLRAEDRALVVKEELMGVEGPLPVEGCSGCQRVRVTVRDCLKPISTASRSFALSVHLNQGLFREGEKAEVSVFSGRTASLLLLDEDPETHVYMVIAPHLPGLPLWTVRAGETVAFPGSDLGSRGITLTARLPEGTHCSTEILRVIATDVPLSPGLYRPRKGKTTFELLSLLEKKGIPWAQEGVVFRIAGKTEAGKDPLRDRHLEVGLDP